MASKDDQKICCSFCGKSEGQAQLIAGPGVYICNECVDLCCSIIDSEPSTGRHSDFDVSSLPKPHEIKAKLDEYVIGQEDAKIALSVAVYNHYKRIGSKGDTDVEIQKSNILMIGPTGSGKTLLAQTLAKILRVPFAIADATSLTEAGYIGDDIESVVSKLLAAADNDVDRAEQGIIFIDEIDKIAKKKNTHSRDVSGESVQQGMLKLLEGAEVEVPVGANSKNAMVPLATVNTKNILFICGGAFEGLEKIINKETESKHIGFNADIKGVDKNNTLDLSEVQQYDLVKFGLMPELIGRFPIICTLQPLEEDDLLRILTEPKNALTKQYQELLAMDDVKLEFEESALHRIAELAVKKEIGARGLRSIIEKAMQKVMYSIPDMTGAKRVIITSGVIDGTEEALVYGARNKKIA